MKVAIIGAGINGLYLAGKLSEKGYKATVFEKRGIVGKVACSGLFSERIFDFFPESRHLIKNKINYGLVHFPKRDFKINFSKNFFAMSHYELDNFAANLAKDRGAEIILNKEIKDGDFPILEKNFNRIIGSDGPNSRTRKYLKMKNPYIKLGIQGFSDEAGERDYFETWPTKSGFLWKIPRGKETEYGILEKPEFAKNIFENFLRENNIEVKNSKSAMIPQSFSIPSHKFATLCGDAAGLTKPWSGGGVIWGLLAADILLKNFPDFLKYEKEMKKFFLPKIFISKTLTRIGNFLGNNMPWALPESRKIESDFLI